MSIISDNPFIYGDPVSPEQFVNRQREVRKLVGRICTGQSSAVIGDPRSGKTSLLRYVQQPALYGDHASRLLFSYLDAQMLGTTFAPPHFWEYVLQPVSNLDRSTYPQVRTAYHTCQRESFGNFGLERLFAHLHQAGHCLVLLLDEFDNLLDNAAFHQAEFFGGLRSLASRSAGLVLVLASRQAPGDLNRKTEEFSRSGSPFFNIVSEITLKPFSQRATNELLARAGRDFIPADREFIIRLADGHPYFLQVAAGELWELREEADLTPEERRQSAGEALYNKAQDTLRDTWRLWKPEMQIAFAIIALNQSPALLGEREFNLQRLREKLADYTPETKQLAKRGYIRGSSDDGWRVTGEVMLWFVADTLVQALRADSELGTLFHAQCWDGMFTNEEREQFKDAVQSLRALLKDNVDNFVKVASLIKGG